MKFKFWAIKISIICIIIFILQLIYQQTTTFFILDAAKVFFEPWRLLTSIFLHANRIHILNNLFALLLFGTIAEFILGSRKFLITFFFGGIFASIVSSFFYDFSLGASGAIFAILGVLTAVRPFMVIWFYGLPMPMFAAWAVWASIDLLGIYMPAGVANFAHLAGLLFGTAYGIYLRRHAGFRWTRKKKIKISDRDFSEWEREYMG